MKRIFLFIFIILLKFSLIQAQFTSFSHFKDSLNYLSGIPDTQTRDSLINLFWNNLKSNRQIPFTFGDSVAFLYRGDVNSVRWAGDFNKWGNINTGYGSRINNTNIWIWEASFPSDARLDYKIILNGNNWILDPNNPYQQWGGFGPNSELRMPDFVYPTETIRDPSAPGGIVSNWEYISSSNLHYTVKFKVYTPAGYDSLSSLPVIYVTDGDEYMHDRLGSMIIVLDNLIYWKVIEPVIAVFISPWDLSGSTNRRMTEYNMNMSFVEFVTRELIPHIDSTYKTNPVPDARAILGTSMGGLNSAYFGMVASDYFHLIGIQSPAFWYNPAIFDLVSNSPKKPLKIYMSTGTIYDTEDGARQMKAIFESKGYPLKYTEVNQSHSWGNWRGLLDELLIFFWPNQANPINERGIRHSLKGFRLLGHYPNPFNSSIIIRYKTPSLAFVQFSIYDVLGRKIYSQFLGKMESGSHELRLNNQIFRSFPSGIYFYEFQFNRTIRLLDKIIYVK